MNKIKIKRVFLKKNVDLKFIKQVSWFFVDKFSFFKKKKFVRELLLNKILLLCFKKRWNVQYELHSRRNFIAISFEAKNISFEQAEFDHSNVAIIFTCLIFYHSSLNYFQLIECLRHLLRLNDSAIEYNKWIYDFDNLSKALHHWNVINIDDQGQIEKLWRYLRFNKNILNCYMNNFVFSIHVKQFDVKLQIFE